MKPGLRPLLLATLLALAGQIGTQARADEANAKQEDMRTTGTVPSGPDIWGEVNALGTGPFWSLRIRDGQITFSRAGKNNIITVNPGPTAATEGSATWSIPLPSLRFTLTVTRENCVDGASDRRYDLAAKLVLQGKTYYGCAASLAAIPAEPAP
jgi:uncharacterized membrane protein